MQVLFEGRNGVHVHVYNNTAMHCICTCTCTLYVCRYILYTHRYSTCTCIHVQYIISLCGRSTTAKVSFSSVSIFCRTTKPAPHLDGSVNMQRHVYNVYTCIYMCIYMYCMYMYIYTVLHTCIYIHVQYMYISYPCTCTLYMSSASLFTPAFMLCLAMWWQGRSM